MNFREIEDLVSIAKNENNLAKELLAKEFTPFIINLSNRTFINGYDKQDIQNECFKILFKCVSLYNLDKHRFVAYAINGIKNSISDLIKKSKNHSPSDGYEALTLSDNLEHVLPSETSSLDEMLCLKADYQSLKQGIDSLDKDERELIIFVFFKNNSLKNYAYWKNMCYSTATCKKRRILAKIKKYLSA